MVFAETEHWLSLPLTVNYIFTENAISPYAFVGGEVGYLAASNSKLQQNYSLAGTNLSLQVKSTIETRNKFNAWALVGLGLRYKIKSGTFHISAGYGYCVLPFVNASKRFSSNTNLYYYQYVEDDFKVNRIYCNIGYSAIFYKIKKKHVANAENVE